MQIHGSDGVLPEAIESVDSLEKVGLIRHKPDLHSLAVSELVLPKG